MVAAGTLNKRINIEQRGGAVDAIGQPIETWTLVVQCWADIKLPSGLAAIKAGADVSIVKASIRIRYRTGLDVGMRVVHGADIYDIKAVLPDRTQGRVDLVCALVK